MRLAATLLLALALTGCLAGRTSGEPDDDAPALAEDGPPPDPDAPPPPDWEMLESDAQPLPPDPEALPDPESDPFPEPEPGSELGSAAPHAPSCADLCMVGELEYECCDDGA